jgi:hypothetical protein
MNKYFKLPLQLWEECDIKVFDADNNMAFDFPLPMFSNENYARVSDNDKRKIVDIINGKEIATKKHNLTYKDGIIYLDDKDFIIIRSWGRLTGLLQLSTKKARQIQDEFAEFIIKKLTPNV